MLYLHQDDEERMSFISEGKIETSPSLPTRRKSMLLATALAMGVATLAGMQVIPRSGLMPRTRNNAVDSIGFMKIGSNVASAPNGAVNTSHNLATSADKVEGNASNNAKIVVEHESNGTDNTAAATKKEGTDNSAQSLDLANAHSPAAAQGQVDLIKGAARDSGKTGAAVADAIFEGKAMTPEETKEWFKLQSEQQKKIAESSLKIAQQTTQDALAESEALAGATNKVVKATSACLSTHTKCVLDCTAQKQNAACVKECTTSKEKCVDKAEGAREDAPATLDSKSS